MKLVSLIINIDDLENFEKCFNSILNQSLGFKNLELILLNNSKNNHLTHYNKYDNVNIVSSIKDIKNLNSDYLMLLDSNVEFFDDSIEFLFNSISSSNTDIVSADFKEISQYKYFEHENILNEKIEISQIIENPHLIGFQPSIFTKIFKKDIILNNDLLNNEYLNFDFLFMINYYLKSSGIKFTEKTICNYHYSDNFLSKKYLIDLNNNLNNYFDILIDNNFSLNFDFLEDIWIKLFCLSDIPDQDKLDVLMSSKFSFRKYKQNSITPKYQFETFVNLINSKKYYYAVRLSKCLALKYPQNKNQIINTLKNQELYFVFFDLDMKPGGTGNATINKVNNLSKLGYNINLLSVDKIKNYKYIRNYFYDEGILSKDVNLVNIYEYYCNKNTFTNTIVKGHIDTNEKYFIEKIQNDDNSISYIYYDQNNKSIKIKEELFINGALVYRKNFIDNVLEYYTFDGFMYLTRIENDQEKKYYLNDRSSSSTVEFTIFNQMLCYFINEYCDTINNKPIVICENTTSRFNINRLDPRNVIKVGSMHGSPFIIDENNEKQINPRISHFKILDDLKALVLLTDSAKNDVMREFDYNHFVSIPNFISDDALEYEPVEKEYDKIGIFSRISPEKNITDAIKAFNIVSKVNDKVILEIYGRTDLYGNNKNELNHLKSLVKHYNLEDKVIFKGYIEDVSEQMRKSLLTLLVSDHEGLPLSLLESMANSTPVVCYDIDYGPKDVITNGVDGIIVEHGDYKALADNIIELLNNPQKAVEMGINAKKKIKNEFSASVTCKKWEDLFVNIYAQTQIDDYERLLKEQNYDKINKRYEKVKDERKNLKKELNKNKREIKKLKKKNNYLKEVNSDLLNSTSWKITRPFRWLMSHLRD